MKQLIGILDLDQGLVEASLDPRLSNEQRAIAALSIGVVPHQALADVTALLEVWSEPLDFLQR